MTTKDYNRMFLDMVGALNKSTLTDADEVIVGRLRSEPSASRVWPSDAALEEALTIFPIYQLLTRGRLRMLLEGVEDALRSPKTEDAHVRRSLTIEHVMPQGWREHWALDPQEDVGAPAERDRILQTIGNLTLVNERLNPALSNSAWQDKRVEMAKHSVLLLNRDLLESSVEGWDEVRIVERSQKMAKLVAQIWPGPESV